MEKLEFEKEVIKNVMLIRQARLEKELNKRKEDLEFLLKKKWEKNLNIMFREYKEGKPIKFDINIEDDNRDKEIIQDIERLKNELDYYKRFKKQIEESM